MSTVIVEYAPLLGLARAMIEAAGTPADLANDVAESLVEANLCGHDSHGAMRLPSYVGFSRKKKSDSRIFNTVIPDKRAELLPDKRPGLAIRRVDGGFGWGQPAARLAARTVIELAARTGVASVTVERCNHVGRLGEYVAMVAEHGLIGLATCNAGPAVAPFNGRERLFGTNPFAFAAPRTAGPRGNGPRPILVDFATSGVAEGKLQVAQAKGQMVAPGLIIDNAGMPSADPAAFYAGGALLPMGQHKGYGISVLADLLGGGLSGLGLACTPMFGQGNRGGNGFIITAYNITDFVAVEDYAAQINSFYQRVRGSQPAHGVSAVLVPGDPEWISREQRMREGIPIPDTTWRALGETAQELGVPLPAVNNIQISASS